MNTNQIIKKMTVLQVSLCLLVCGCTKSAKENAPEQKEAASSFEKKPTNGTETLATGTMLWNDEFNGPTLNTTKWEVMHNKRRKDPTGRDAWWHSSNAYLSGTGHLVIRTSQLADGSYAGACVRTKGKFERAYGYFEIKAKLQTQEGHWGAFWLFASSVNTVGNQGQDGTEIDVFESPYIGLGQNRMQSALHYDGYGTAHQSTSKSTTDMVFNDGNWHKFGVEWTATEYKFYYDGRLVWTTNFGGISKVPQYIKISDEIGSWGGILDIRNATLPDYMLVDYVRVYDKR